MKQLLKLIGSFVVNGNPKFELDNALVDFERNLIVATDTRQAIRVSIPPDTAKNCSGKHLVAKKVLKAVEGLCAKDDTLSFEDNCLVAGRHKISVNTVHDPFKYPDHDRIYDFEFYDVFSTDEIMQLDFELTHLNTHIDAWRLAPLMEYTGPSQYHVYFKAQENGNPGMAKIVAFDADRSMIFEAMYMAVEFKPRQPSLFDIESAA